MQVTKCDICKKVIKNWQRKIVAGLALDRWEICPTCGNPVIKFLWQKKLISQQDLAKLLET